MSDSSEAARPALAPRTPRAVRMVTRGARRYDPPLVRALVDSVPGSGTVTGRATMGKGNKTRKKEVKKPKQDKKRGPKPAKK